MHKKILFSLLVITVSAGLFSACSHAKNANDTMLNEEYEQKNAVITVTGTLSKNGELFFVTDAAGTIHDVETYAVAFDEYVGQTVTVSGQYSGNTLFVTEISSGSSY
ncbi:MAG: hypothetical protein BroJett025_11290 [Patescibacteria group bacterium]|nr:MAG: hypothetical protein BroJett025_11290 [Patescibacteria group bacterium]